MWRVGSSSRSHSNRSSTTTTIHYGSSRSRSCSSLADCGTLSMPTKCHRRMYPHANIGRYAIPACGCSSWSTSGVDSSGYSSWQQQRVRSGLHCRNTSAQVPAQKVTRYVLLHVSEAARGRGHQGACAVHGQALAGHLSFWPVHVQRRGCLLHHHPPGLSVGRVCHCSKAHSRNMDEEHESDSSCNLPWYAHPVMYRPMSCWRTSCHFERPSFCAVDLTSSECCHYSLLSF